MIKPVYAGNAAPAPPPDALTRARANALRQTRLVRAKSLRRRIIAGAVALFVASWLMITAVLVSGHDPALAQRATSTVAVSSNSSGTSSSATTGTSGATTSSTAGSTGGTTGSTGTSGGTTSSASSSPSSVVTRQS